MEPIFSNVPVRKESVPKAVSQSPSPAGKPALRKLSADISGPSIKSALEGHPMQGEKISVKEQHLIFTQTTESQHFNEEMLMEKWAEVLETLNDRPNLKSALNRKPHLNADGTVTLKLDNLVQEELVRDYKPQLLAWLRRELKNSTVEVFTELMEVPSVRIIYTDGEKFEEMLKKNGCLALLKQKFNLDFDN